MLHGICILIGIYQFCVPTFPFTLSYHNLSYVGFCVKGVGGNFWMCQFGIGCDISLWISRCQMTSKSMCVDCRGCQLSCQMLKFDLGFDVGFGFVLGCV